MQQEVIIINKERLMNQGYKECPDCNKFFKRLELCKDGKKRCKNCKKKKPTNKFYNPLYDKRKGFIGKFSINEQEYQVLIQKYLNKGLNYQLAKSKVNYDLTCMKNNKAKKRIESKNIELKNNQDKKLNKNFLKGLGLKCKE